MEYWFNITREPDGGYVAECISEPIFTQGDNWDELKANVQEATEAYCFDKPAPQRIHLHLVHDEILNYA